MNVGQHMLAHSRFSFDLEAVAEVASYIESRLRSIHSSGVSPCPATRGYRYRNHAQRYQQKLGR
jgi:hypothetical protein